MTTRVIRILATLALAALGAAGAARGATAPAATSAPAARPVVTASAPAVAAPARPVPVKAVTANAPPPGTGHVTYVTGGSVYIDAGRVEGLHSGDTLVVWRDGSTVTRLLVTDLSSHRAACGVLPGSPMPRVDDIARFVPRLDPGPPVAAAPVPGKDAAIVPLAATGKVMPPAATVLIANPPRARSSRMRGRLGMRLLAIQSREAGRMTQPALDARFEAVNAAGLPVDLLADVRGRRTTRSLSTGINAIESSTRVYRLAASLHDFGARYRFTLGRQASPLLSSVSLFDGALAEWGSKRMTLGAFGGTQPDPVRLTMSQDVMQSGAFLEVHQAPLAVRRWSTAVGGVTSTARGQVNRDFVFVQAMYNDPVVSFSMAQEADILRGWKRDSSGAALSLTSTFATVNLIPAEGLSINGGYDGRRNVRLYRDRETPETAFDDRFREGGWVGASLDMGTHVRFAGDARSMGGSRDRANAWSASGEVMRLARVNGRLRSRYSRSDSPASRSELVAFGLGIDPLGGSHLELGGGTRTTLDVLAGTRDRAVWTNTDLDLSLMRRMLFSISWEHTVGQIEHVDQEYAGLSVRF